MTEKIWDEKPDSIEKLTRFDDYDQHEFNQRIYVAEEMDAWLEKLKVEHDLLKEHSGRWLHFVALDYTELRESFSPQKLMELKEKAEQWDKLQDHPHFADMTIERILEESEFHVKRMNIRSRQIEDVKTHLIEYPDPNKGACKDCPYPAERKTREAACGKCAIGIVKFWLEDHEKILGVESVEV